MPYVMRKMHIALSSSFTQENSRFLHHRMASHMTWLWTFYETTLKRDTNYFVIITIVPRSYS